MPGRDPEGRSEKGDLRRRHPEPGKNQRELVAELAIKIEVDVGLDLARLVARLHGRNWLPPGRHLGKIRAPVRRFAQPSRGRACPR